MPSALEKALAALESLTPLRQDCGRLCDAACCRDDGEEELGMLLFPGEADLYDEADAAWMRILPSGEAIAGAEVPLLVCDGVCPRERRPLACRIFPLGPKARKSGVKARLDARSRAMCPLAEYGRRGLAPEFVAAVEEALALLWEDAEQREYLLWLSALIDDYAAMLRMFRAP